MNIKWENNSRVQRLYSEGKIEQDDIIKRTQTDKFPAEAATVRIQRLKDKTPTVTIHIRGKSVKRQYTPYNGNPTIYECADTCRVNISNDWKTGTMSSNGDLDKDYNWQDVHNVVTEVKTIMGIKY